MEYVVRGEEAEEGDASSLKWINRKNIDKFSFFSTWKSLQNIYLFNTQQ